VHPSLPYLLTSSDDMLIKLWDWDKARASLRRPARRPVLPSKPACT
jgi:hypothetical protein